MLGFSFLVHASGSIGLDMLFRMYLDSSSLPWEFKPFKNMQQLIAHLDAWRQMQNLSFGSSGSLLWNLNDVLYSGIVPAAFLSTTYIIISLLLQSVVKNIRDMLKLVCLTDTNNHMDTLGLLLWMNSTGCSPFSHCKNAQIWGIFIAFHRYECLSTENIVRVHRHISPCSSWLSVQFAVDIMLLLA